MTRSLRLLVAVLLAAALGAPGAWAQAVKGNYPVQTRGTPGQQNSLKVDNSTTPQRTNIGCETDQEKLQNTGVYRLYGIAITWTHALY